MTDIIDTANDIAQQTIERAIANAPKLNIPSATHCVMCEDEIPPERQQPGNVIYCIECQKYIEKQKRLFKR